jgi:hypothetical protein
MTTPAATRKSAPSPALVVGGYLGALFVPIVGIILGVIAMNKYDGTGANHGPWIIGLSIASMISALVLMASMGG